MLLANQHLKQLRRLHQKKFRRQSGLFLIEGLRLCETAVEAKAVLREVVVCPEVLSSDRASQWLKSVAMLKIDIHHAAPRQITALAATETPQGIMAVVEQAKPQSLANVMQKENLLLALQDIADPGNLGTILRSTNWFGIKSVFLSPGCADVYNPKVVRASMGAIFYLNLHENAELLQVIEKACERDYRIIAALPQGGKPLSEFKPAVKQLLLIGSEAQGLPSTVAAVVHQKITIARQGMGESLNAAVAASIILYEFSKQKK